MEVEANVLVCPSCQLKHRIKPEMAGKRAKCKCGTILEIPAAAKQQEADDLYDVADTPTQVTRAPKHVAASAPAATAPKAKAPDMSEDAALAKGYAPMHKRVETEDENPPPEPNFFLDVVLPVILIPIGIALCFVQAMYFDKGSPKPFSMIAGTTIVGMIASLALMVVAVLGTGAAVGMVFEGPMWQTILKICGIALIPATLGAMIDHSVEGINGNILSVFGAIGVYLLLTKIVLRQPWQDTGIIVFTLWVIRAIVMYCIYKIQSAQMGSSI